MKKINRKTFIRQTISASALALMGPFANELFASGNKEKRENIYAEDIYKRLVKANDVTVAELVKVLSNEIDTLRRGLGYDFAHLSSAFCEPTSAFYQKQELVGYMSKILQFLIKNQSSDGTLDLGNLGSPPDTGFILEPLCAGTSILMKNKRKELNDIKVEAKQFILKTGDALSEGGIHTPNHRWVVCAALARINALYPNTKYTDRITDWLGEGIFIDKDGQYLERSVIYSGVINGALITMARLLNMPTLLEPVRKNLSLTYFLTEPNGNVVTTASRRQDQFLSQNILNYYSSYRYLAIRDNNKEFAAITKFIESVDGFDKEVISNSLFHFMEDPLLKKELPTPSPLSDNFEKLFSNTHLARIRRGHITTTIFGGIDWPLVIASGRSTSPNFFSYRKGEAVLKYIRLSSAFFSTGFFRSDGLKKEGGKYILHKKLEVPYYQPLPANLRKEDGDYTLSPSVDGRFWNKMDFENRPISNVKMLESTITIEENNGSNTLTFSVTGSENVPVTIELVFKEGGKLVGVASAKDQATNSFLENGMGEYQFGKDTIKFGPGKVQHRKVGNLDGEMYTSHFGTLRTEGMHVYLTGITPFEHKITIS